MVSASVSAASSYFLYPWYLLNQWMEFHQTCVAISLGLAQELIGLGDHGLIFKVTGGKKMLKIAFSALCLLKGLPDFAYTWMDISYHWEMKKK